MRKMDKKLAAQVHAMRKIHWSYDRIVKELGMKRNTLQNYYYKWLRENNRRPWGLD